jgi:hypothetical protein
VVNDESRPRAELHKGINRYNYQMNSRQSAPLHSPCINFDFGRITLRRAPISKFDECVVSVCVIHQPRQEVVMLAQEVLLKIQKGNFYLLVRQQLTLQRCLRYLAFAHT